MADSHDRFNVQFECTALDDPEALRVLGMHGREELSRPFVFDVHVRPKDDFPLDFEDFEAIMGGSATLSFGPDRDHPIHGVVREIELLPAYDTTETEYRMRLVPRFADTRLTRGSWIFQDQKPADIIKSAFALSERAAFADEEDFELLLDGSYTPREYVVQYEESLFNFISRQAEHWGVFYYFDHLGEHDKLIFGDTNSRFPELEGFEKIGFEGRAGATANESIRSLRAVQRMVQHQVSLRDYNYRIPSVPLVTELATVDEGGIGDVHVTGDHFWTPDEGTALSEVRSQEMFAKKRRVSAQSTVRGLRAGHRFGLTGAYPEGMALARDYLVVAVEHRYLTDGDGDLGIPYSNTLELLPLEVAFRPERITPKPRIYGVMHAKIDSEADDDGTNVPVDDWGRYKVLMPFDVAGKEGGKSSCWVRTTTASTGGGWGFAQGMHVGSEVAVYHIDGDPDRPVIAGSVMNFERPSVVTGENANQCVVSSRKGIVMSFNDA